ncbi:glycosyltransferase family 4 protein [Siccirubricoccus sp. G192]|uniref:glycosyltransferase family 4 protein n=1 Tax=Siccirubricoccus sp. G192 TaxID=2849651 RepID=UPI001C2CAD31|nr:glycosyltransferase family 4 protein [Siccirubricoccus sp. G192]MBV1796212.1 glycosyltransferase family 4 protein [Siccirubricoccus sp. G192]
MLLPSGGIGGVEVHSVALARALARSGLTLRLAIEPALRPRFAALLGPDLAPGLEGLAIGWYPEVAAEANIRRQAAAAMAAILAARPDAAILPLPWPTHGLGIQQALAEAGVPVLAVAHLAPRELDPPTIAAAQALRPGPTRWVAVSDPVAARLATCFGLPPGAVTTVTNGVPLPRERPGQREAARAAKRRLLGLPGTAPLLVFAGRLEPNKGADLLPGIAQRLPPGMVLAALGEGPLAPVLAAHPAAGGAARPGPLRLLGQMGDVAEWLLAADALLLPSRLEGCPLVFLEAAARRCPVVATEAALEAFGDAAFDLAAVAGEATAGSLAGRVAASLAEPARRWRKVAAAWQHAVAHDEAAMFRHYAGLLRALAGPRAGDASLE